MHTQDLVGQMRESIPQRRFMETTEAFCELLTRGYPLRQAVRDILDAGAPYTHLPYHVSIQNGRPYEISNDHCLLDTRAALYLMRYMPPETHLLPVVQSVWYWPQGIDVWGQTKLEGWSGDTTDTILGLINVLKVKDTPRYPTPEDWQVYPPSQRCYTSEVAPMTEGSVEERLEAFRTAVMLCEQDEAYGLFVELASEEGIRKRLESELLYAALTDVQERIRQGHLKTLQHTTLRARALIDLADYVGWDQAQSVFQAAIPDIAMGPRYYALHDHVATLCEEEFGNALGELKARNITPLTPQETDEVIKTICGTDPWPVSGLITRLLKEGKAIRSIADAITLAAARVVTLAERHGSNPIIWVHSVDYCNVVNTWLRRYEHPYQPQGLYFMALVTHYAVPAFPKPAFTDSVDRVRVRCLHGQALTRADKQVRPSISQIERLVGGHRCVPPEGGRKTVPDTSVDLLIDRSRISSHLVPDDLVRQLSASIENLDVPTSLQYADAYLQAGTEARSLTGALALAASKTQDNPHHHKIVCTALEECELSGSPQKGELLLMAAAYLSAARSMCDCYQLYTRYFPA